MRISAINNNNFTGIYKLPNRIGYHTEKFINENTNQDNRNMAVTSSYNENYKFLYVITKDDKEFEQKFENAIKRDYGKYCKLSPLMDIWVNGNIAQAAFKTQKALNNGENWIKFIKTDTEEIPF